MFNDIKRLSFKHKNNKFIYYLKNYSLLLVPRTFFSCFLQRKLSQIKNYDEEYINTRVNYYNKLTNNTDITEQAIELGRLSLGKKMKVYFFDVCEVIRYFNQHYRANFLFGDITYIPERPSIVKSRPIAGDNKNSVLLKLVKIRHFVFVDDRKPFSEKKDMLISRNKAQQEHRVRFLEMYFNHPMCNIGQVNTGMNPQYISNRLTITEHLDYKFILCLEGWDVASNLKWVMSSNSLAVMPKPTYETWFMEGTLIPDYHYVLIRDDYSDLEERMRYYIEHQDKAQEILRHAHEYIDQFKNQKREKLIALRVMDKYFEKTSQKK